MNKLQEFLDSILKPKENTVKLETDSPLTIFKQKNGTYRWMLISSTAYRDHDGHIVSMQAHEADANRMNEEKDYGVLRWWHVGMPTSEDMKDWTKYKSGDGINLGTSDYSEIIEKCRVESGEFDDSTLAESLLPFAANLAPSIGFSHPEDEPNSEGIFSNIKTFERSLLPRGKESNFLTSQLILTKKESLMADMKEKLETLQKMVGEEVMKDLISRLQSTDKAAEILNVDYKEKEKETPDPVSPVEEKAMAMGEMQMMVEKCVKENMEKMMVELKSLMSDGAQSKESKFQSILTESKEREESILIALKAVTKASEENAKQIRELMGEIPNAAKGYRATEDKETDVNDLLNNLAHLKGKNPQADPKQQSTLDQFVKFATTGQA
jgi:hypothetical protein